LENSHKRFVRYRVHRLLVDDHAHTLSFTRTARYDENGMQTAVHRRRRYKNVVSKNKMDSANVTFNN